MVKNKKILLIVLLFLLLLVFNTKVFASSNVDSLLTDTYKYYFIVKNPSTQDVFLIVTPNTSLVDSYEGSSTVFWDFKANAIRFYKFNKESYSWDETSIEDIPSFKWRNHISSPNGQLEITYDRDYEFKLINYIGFSNYDIMNHPNSGGTVYYAQHEYNSTEFDFFCNPPQGVQLLTPMKVEEIPTMITKLLIILVPVGLTIFGALLLVYLLHSRKWLHL